MSPEYSALDAVSAAVYATLNVASLLALAPGGVGDNVAQLTTFPNVFYELHERNMGGLGSKPGSGKPNLELDLRAHVYSQYAGMKEAHVVMNKVLELLRDPPVVIGFGSWAITYHETVPLPDEILAGVSVRELVSSWTLCVSEA